MKTLLLALLTLSAAQDAPRLGRPVAFPESGEIPGDATVGQLVVDTYDKIETRHPGALPVMGEAYICGSSNARLLQSAAVSAAKQPSAPAKTLLKAHDAAALTALATDTVAQLDGVDAAKIRADEAIGPGIYHNSIVAIAFTIDHCRFY